ncbi:glycoside hydrolase family 32 protein [Cohnella candidum]|uniref:Glycoside hydrolase family 32 protein n=1 Tax=Cohnella candidum TaxID=2674991 RepID=A0A3G3K1U3_9BACL|nr:glycoside hydrolase family 32 protein [Cohnella candidum]AYQ73729.1 glycoside hydrolase family 32 protein [Cohnella candidum]
MHQETYAEPYRLQYHLSPPEGPMSDPNGMVYFEGEYHQFYQFTGRWGHAVSRDLVYWEHLPLAIDRDELGDAWSGSAVVDAKDTSGLFGGKPGLVAIFTHCKNGVQSQSIAYSSDRGRSWRKYNGNPVLPNSGLKDFRDPKVIWHPETGKWVMVVSADKRVQFYSSPNLIDWAFESEFGEGQGSHAAVWECPDLFPLDVDGDPARRKWVLHVSIGDNDETDGSTAQYFIGRFDGKRFVNDLPPEEVRWTDFGQDFYAAVSYSDIPDQDGRRIWLGWMSNWKYPFHVPTSPWKGAMSVPRVLRLRTEGDTVRLVQEPIDELKKLREVPWTANGLEVSDGTRKLAFEGACYEFEMTVEWEKVEEFGVRMRVSGSEATEAGYYVSGNRLFVDRTRSGFSDIIGRSGKPVQFDKCFETERIREGNELKMRGFVDASSVEIFFDDGLQTFTSLIYPNGGSTGLELFAIGGAAVFRNLRVYPIKSIWRR